MDVFADNKGPSVVCLNPPLDSVIEEGGITFIAMVQ